MAYDSVNKKITAPVSMYDVQRCLATSKNSLKDLCTHANVNIWSKCKPRFNSMAIKSPNAVIPYSNNFIVKSEVYNSETIYYLASLIPETGMFYNLHDFNGYDHLATKPTVRFVYDNLFSGFNAFNYTKYITRAEFLKNIIAYNGGNLEYSGDERPLAIATPSSYILPQNLTINSNDEIEIPGTFNTLSNKAYWLFDNLEFNSESSIPYFVNTGTSAKIYLDRNDAIAAQSNVKAKGIFDRPTTINPHVGGSTKDIPLKPVIKINNVIPPDTDVYTADYFFITQMVLTAIDSTNQGGGIAYTIKISYKYDYLKYGGKNYNVNIRPELYSINWPNKTTAQFDMDTDSNYQYADNAGTPNFGQTENIRIAFSGATNEGVKNIHLQTIPFDDMFTADGIWNERADYGIKLNITLTQV